MKAVITGDLVNSVHMDAAHWMPVLKAFLSQQGSSPRDWEIFRGDSFQFVCEANEAFLKYMLLKSALKQMAPLDVRAAIGLGHIGYQSRKITEANGTAFTRSGRTFDSLGDKQYLAFSTGEAQTDRTLNLFARFASIIMDNWSAAVAVTVQVFLENPNWNQQRVAEKLGINQSAASQNRKRAQLDLLLDFSEYYITVVNSLKS